MITAMLSQREALSFLFTIAVVCAGIYWMYFVIRRYIAVWKQMKAEEAKRKAEYADRMAKHAEFLRNLEARDAATRRTARSRGPG
jgi:hypothetical protein